MKITSPAFVNGETIPALYTCDGKNINPPLEIKETPAAAKSLVLIMDDVDAPAGVFTHWLVFDIFSGITRVSPGSAPEGIPGKNTFGQENYGGPCPHSGTHRYYFRVFALDKLLKLPSGSTREKVEAAMKDHVLDQAELMVIYAKV